VSGDRNFFGLRTLKIRNLKLFHIKFQKNFLSNKRAQIHVANRLRKKKTSLEENRNISSSEHQKKKVPGHALLPQFCERFSLQLSPPYAGDGLVHVLV